MTHKQIQHRMKTRCSRCGVVVANKPHLTDPCVSHTTQLCLKCAQVEINNLWKLVQERTQEKLSQGYKISMCVYELQRVLGMSTYFDGVQFGRDMVKRDMQARGNYQQLGL